MTKKLVGVESLNLGDVVRLGPGPFMDAVVKKITYDGHGLAVTVERPYMSSEDFSYAGGVIVTIGHEDVTYLSGELELIQAKGPLRDHERKTT